MRFDKKRFKDAMSSFKYGKEELKDDFLMVTGQVVARKDFEFSHYMGDDFEEKMKSIYGDKIYKFDGNYVMMRSEVTLLSLIFLPIVLVSLLTMRFFGLLALSITLPFAAANSIVFK